jgi:hypothetical protein
MTVQLNNNQNDNSIVTNTYKSRRGKRIFRIRRGSLNWVQQLPSLEGQISEGGISLEHWILSGMGMLEPVLVRKSEPTVLTDRGYRYRPSERRLAKPDVEIQEWDWNGSPDPY